MLTVSEIYRTILGESRDSGRLCAIVRLIGCHRRCSYCDSAYAFHGGEQLSVDQVAAKVRELGTKLVLVTGGEPTLQEDCPALLAALLADGREVDLEMSGTLGGGNVTALPKAVRRIVDIKTPGSGIASDQIDWSLISNLSAHDEIKFVCTDRIDYDWARQLIVEGRLPDEVPTIFSPVHGQLASSQLADWIVADVLDVRMQIQLHKILWPGQDQGV